MTPITPQHPCSICSCTDLAPAWHAITAALGIGDVDAALHAGLLDAPACPGCSQHCTSVVLRAREERIQALAARDRYRARTLRVQAREKARRQQRTSDARTPSALPDAAAAALARAKARAGPGS